MIEAVRRMRDGVLHYQVLQKEVQAATARLERGEGIVLEGDDALGRFFDEIEAEVEQEIASKHASQS